MLTPHKACYLSDGKLTRNEARLGIYESTITP